MKKFKDFILALMVAGAVSACTGQDTIPEPVIGDISVSDVTVYSARISGSVTVPNTTDLLEFGIELSTDYMFDPLKTVSKTEADAEEFSIAVKDLDYARTRGFHSDFGWGIGQGADLYALRTQAVFRSFVEPYRPIDARSGVPTGVRQFGVVCHDGQRVLASITEAVKFYEKAGIAVRLEGKLFTVKPDGSVFIYTLKLHQDGLFCPVCQKLQVGELADSHSPLTAQREYRYCRSCSVPEFS